MESDHPHLVVLAGPNGAGKSTAAAGLLAEGLQVKEFVNADVIAQGLSAFQPEKTAIQAGKIMLERLHQLAAQRVDFAYETTLASRSFVPWIADLCKSGYGFHLVFLWLPNAEMAIERVSNRVRLGGHAVPSETIRRRYHAGLANFFNLYHPLTETWRFYDNTNASGPRLVASGGGTVVETIRQPEAWAQILEGVAK
jgi:predicted ABC-type ATPase